MDYLDYADYWLIRQLEERGFKVIHIKECSGIEIKVIKASTGGQLLPMGKFMLSPKFVAREKEETGDLSSIFKLTNDWLKRVLDSLDLEQQTKKDNYESGK